MKLRALKYYGTYLIILLLMQSCASPRFDVVALSIEPSRHWKIDAAGYLIYKESLFGPRLAIFISPQLNSSQPLRIQFTFHTNFKNAIGIDLRKIILKSDGKSFTSYAATCKLPGSNIDKQTISVSELAHDGLAPCLYLLFDARQPKEWHRVSLHLDGLFKDSVSIAVPEIRFYKTTRARPGSFA